MTRVGALRGRSFSYTKVWACADGRLDLSRFRSAPLIEIIAPEEINYGTNSDDCIPQRCMAMLKRLQTVRDETAPICAPRLLSSWASAASEP